MVWIARIPPDLASLPRFIPDRGRIEFGAPAVPRTTLGSFGAVAVPAAVVDSIKRRGYLTAIVTVPRRGNTLSGLGAAAPAAGAGAAGASAVGAAAGLVKSRSATVNYAAQGASAGASVGSVVPGIGTAIGAVVGAIVGAIGGAFIGAKRPESALWDEYKKLAGTNRGIEYDPQFLNEAFVGLFRLGRNTFPPRARGGYGPQDDARFIDDMAKQIASAIREGRIGATDDSRSIFAKVIAPWVAQWGVEANADWKRWEDNILIDKIDQYIYDVPSVPTSYTQSRRASPSITEVIASLPKAGGNVAPVASTTPVAPTTPPPGASTTPVTAPNVVTTLPVLPAPATPPALTPTATGNGTVSLSPQPAVDVAAIVNQLLQQGASQQQAYAQTLQALQSRGVQTTPAVQQEVAGAVSQAGASLPSWLIPGALGLLALSFALARPIGARAKARATT